jgi:hypothetical protein
MDNREQLIKNLTDARKLAYAELEQAYERVDQIDKLLSDLGVDVKSLESLDHKEKEHLKETVVVNRLPPTTPEQNLNAVIAILRHGGPMRRSDIAKQAFSRSLIISTNGEDGVDAIVGNILSRNAPRLFKNTGWGWWTLSHASENTTDTTIKFPATG